MNKELLKRTIQNLKDEYIRNHEVMEEADCQQLLEDINSLNELLDERTARDSTVNWLLSYFLEYHFQDKVLANVCDQTFVAIKDELIGRFDSLGLTDADIKEAWKSWFDEASFNGTLVAPYIQFANNDDLRIIDLTIELANKAIDAL